MLCGIKLNASEKSKYLILTQLSLSTRPQTPLKTKQKQICPRSSIPTSLITFLASNSYLTESQNSHFVILPWVSIWLMVYSSTNTFFLTAKLSCLPLTSFVSFPKSTDKYQGTTGFFNALPSHMIYS